MQPRLQPRKAESPLSPHAVEAVTAALAPPAPGLAAAFASHSLHSDATVLRSVAQSVASYVTIAPLAPMESSLRTYMCA